MGSCLLSVSRLTSFVPFLRLIHHLVQDKQCVAHVGSVRFRSIIESYRQRYANSLTKFDKMQITKEIYETLSQSSRFLKFNTQEKVWEEISPMAARDKCGHALRFANRNKSKGKNATGMRVAPETASLLRSSPSMVSACNSSAASSAQAPSPAPPRVASPPSTSTMTMPSTMPTLQLLQQQQQQQASQSAMPQLQLSQQQHQEAALAALKRYDSLWNAARIPVVTNPGAAAAAAMGQAAPMSSTGIVTPESLLTTVLKQHQEQQRQQQTAAHHRKRSTLEDLCSILAVVEPSARQILGGN